MNTWSQHDYHKINLQWPRNRTTNVVTISAAHNRYTTVVRSLSALVWLSFTCPTTSKLKLCLPWAHVYKKQNEKICEKLKNKLPFYLPSLTQKLPDYPQFINRQWLESYKKLTKKFSTSRKPTHYKGDLKILVCRFPLVTCQLERNCFLSLRWTS